MSDNTDHAHGDTVGGTEEPEYEDILGDCTILVKRVVVNQNISPNVGERVTIKWKREIPELGKTFPEEDLTFTLGDGDVEQALELITSLMKLGEKFTVIAGYKYMYGDTGEPPDIPPKANFKFDIELVSNAGIVDYPNMDFDTRFNEAKKKKERGNVLFRRRDYPQALNLYQTACKIVDRDLGFDFPHEAPKKLQEVQEFRAVILCNTSVAQIKMQLYDAAVLSAREATKICPAYSKAYYRLGQAYDKCRRTEEAMSAYTKAIQLHNGDAKLKLTKSEVSFLQDELERLQENKQQTKDKEKEIYSRMFGDMTPSKGTSKNGVRRKSSKSKGTGDAPNDAPSDEELKTESELELSVLQQAADATFPSPTSSETDSAYDFDISETSLETSLEYATPETSPSRTSGRSAAREISEFNLDSEEDMAAMAAILKQEIPSLLSKLSEQMSAVIPGFQEDLKEFQRTLAEGMKEEEAVAMATTFLIQLGLDPDMQDPAQLMALSRQISALIPENIRAHFEKYAETLTEEDDCQGNNNLALLLRKVSDMERRNSHVEKEDHITKEIADVRSNLKKVQHTRATDDEGYDGGAGVESQETEQRKTGESVKVEENHEAKGDKKPVDRMINLWERKIQGHVFSPEVRTAREEVLEKRDSHDAGKSDSRTICESETDETLTDELLNISLSDEDDGYDLCDRESDAYLHEAASKSSYTSESAANAGQSPVIDSTTSSSEDNLDKLDGFQTEIFDHMIAAAANGDLEQFGSKTPHNNHVSSSTPDGLPSLPSDAVGRSSRCYKIDSSKSTDVDLVAELEDASRDISVSDSHSTNEVSSSSRTSTSSPSRSSLAASHSSHSYNLRSLGPIHWPTTSELQQQIDKFRAPALAARPSNKEVEMDEDEADQDKAGDYIRSNSGSKIATVEVSDYTPPEEDKGAVWSRRAGLAVLGLGVLGLAGIVIYRYTRK